jgi:Pyridine nucleotide-disulphide oxidoreductase
VTHHLVASHHFYFPTKLQVLNQTYWGEERFPGKYILFQDYAYAGTIYPGYKNLKSQLLTHMNGHIQNIIFRDGSKNSLKALYAPVPFEQHCSIPASLGCELTEEGYIKIDSFLETTINGVFACGNNSSTMRTVANAVAMGTTFGMIASRKIIMDEFKGLTQ